ncbi:MAG: hypothetical protein ACJASK_001052, partial [Ilumatobacter sp.]
MQRDEHGVVAQPVMFAAPLVMPTRWVWSLKLAIRQLLSPSTCHSLTDVFCGLVTGSLLRSIEAPGHRRTADTM